MVNYRIQRTILVIGRATELDPDRAVVGDMVLEFLHQPGFANAGLAAEQDDLAFTGCGLLPAAAEESEFFVPTHQRCESSLDRHLKPTLDLILFPDSIQHQRSRYAFEVRLSSLFTLK